MYFSIFYWKKHGLGTFMYYFLEALLKVRPLIGLYTYIIKNKKRIIIKICPHYMAFIARWRKALY